VKFAKLLDYIKPIVRTAAVVAPNPALAIGAVVIEAIDAMLDDAADLDDEKRAAVYRETIKTTRAVLDKLEEAVADGVVTEAEHTEALTIIHDAIIYGEN